MLFGHITCFNTIISIKTTIANIISSCHMFSRRWKFVCELFSITRIDQDFLLAI